MIDCHGFQRDADGYRLFVEGNSSFIAGSVEPHEFMPWVTVLPTPHNHLAGFERYVNEESKPKPRVFTPAMELLLGLTKSESKLIKFPVAQLRLVEPYAALFTKIKFDNPSWLNNKLARKKLSDLMLSTTAGVVLLPPSASDLLTYQTEAFFKNIPVNRLALLPVTTGSIDYDFSELEPLNPTTANLLAYEAIFKWTSR